MYSCCAFWEGLFEGKEVGRDRLAIRIVLPLNTCPLAVQYVPSCRSIRVLLMLNR